MRTLQEKPERVDWVAIASLALVVVSGITLFTTCLFPIYPDEIQVRFWLSRMPYDLPDIISGAPTCLAAFLQRRPATMYLPGMIDWALHGRLETLPALRRAGLIVAFFWVGGLFFYLKARVKGSLPNGGEAQGNGRLGLKVAGSIIALFSVGVFPFFLVTNRGEQLILPSVVVLIAVFLRSARLDSKGRRPQRAGLIMLYFAAVSVILYGHPKGLFLTPFFMVVGWELFSHFESRWPLAFGTAFLLFQITQDIAALRKAFQCSELSLFEARLKSFSIDPISLFHDPRRFFVQVFGSFARFPRYWDQLGFQEYTDIAYLPRLPLSGWALLSNILVRANVCVGWLELSVLLPFQCYRKDLAVGRFVTVNSALLTLFGCTVISAILNLPKNWYDAGYLYAVSLIILIFFIGENDPGIVQGSAGRKIILYLAGVSLLSQAVLIGRNLPEFAGGYSGPGVSISNYDAIKTQADLAAASRTCGIDPVRGKGIVVDDFTYLYFQKSRTPLAFTYISIDNDEDAIRGFLAKAESDGLAVNCASLLDFPSFLNSAIIRRTGDVCCIRKDKLKNLIKVPS